MKRFMLILLLGILTVCIAQAETLNFNGSAYVEYGDFQFPDLYYTFPADNKAEAHYDALDDQGRAGSCYAVVTRNAVDGQRRNTIADITPSGFQQAQYSFIEGGYLYQRCHLIGAQLAVGTEIPENLITGTTYMNLSGMYTLEMKVASYVLSTGKSVFYQVIPDFRGEEVVCRGVWILAAALEGPEDFSFQAYCFNVQPGVVIDYSNGYSDLAATAGKVDTPRESGGEEGTEMNYVLNIKSHVFHYPNCSGVSNMKENNKKEYSGNREDLINMGYKPCGICNP